MSNRNTIIEAIKTELALITTGNGFSYTQNSNYIFDWFEKKFDLEIDTTSLEVRDIGSDIDDDEGLNRNILHIEIAIMDAGETVGSSLRNKMSDIHTAMKNVRNNNTNIIDDIRPTGDDTFFDREVKKMGETTLFYDIYYTSTEFEI